MGYRLNLTKTGKKNIFSLDERFRGKSKSGEEISFTNYYMEKNGKPFFGICGEIHFSRVEEESWRDEILKMKMGGINVITTYIFWIHHEEKEGEFDFSGNRNLRKFVELCQECGMYVIIRIGPFDHGEVRNGGLPDWLYGKPFDVRSINEGFLFYTRRLYKQIAAQTAGLFFKEDGPIIGTQIDNEYMHSAAPWELTTGVSNEWISAGTEGTAYMVKLKDLALECGIEPVFFTCTGWGGAATPDSMMPLWGGYAFRPWLFYSHRGEHPSTEEYVYQDFHHNGIVCNYDFDPQYAPEDRPYACCEMGGGMFSSYNYRFQFDYKSVDAMANIKIGSGCNFLGYYMYHGGTNPVGKTGIFLNESQTPKRSYDFQAAIGEFGQERESFRRLKAVHFFVTDFAEQLCNLKTMLPKGASYIQPKDMKTLRFAVRTDGKRGFLFVNNYQDHQKMMSRSEECVTLKLSEEELQFHFGIAGDENAILPFHMNIGGMDLVQATAQPVTVVETEGEKTFVFMAVQGMKPEFIWEEGCVTAGEKERGESFEARNVYQCKKESRAEQFWVKKGEKQIHVLVISRELADQMYKVSKGRLIFTKEALLEDEKGLRLETKKGKNLLLTYPADALKDGAGCKKMETDEGPLGTYFCERKEKKVELTVEKTGSSRYTIEVPEHYMEGLKEAILKIRYQGDIGQAFLGGELVHDNFCNGADWEIGLRFWKEKLEKEKLVIYITPLKEGANVNVESAMAGRAEEVKTCLGELESAVIQPVYEIKVE